MGILEILLISIGLAMDAFAVSICKGLSMSKLDHRKMLIIGAYFGIFQAGMPVIGFLLCRGFESFVTSIDHWIAFILLSFIGVNMIRDSFSKEEVSSGDTGFKEMCVLAIATSIDALAVRNNICIFRCKYFFISSYNWSYNIFNISNRGFYRK